MSAEIMELDALEKFLEALKTVSVTNILLTLSVACAILYLVLYLSEWFNRWKRRPPGPIGLPLVGYLPFLGLEPHKTLWKMKKKYGDVIGLYMGTKYTVILNKYSIVKEVISHPGALDRAPNLFDIIPRSGFVSANGEVWQEQRRFCMHATRDLGLGRGQWEEHIMEEVLSYTQELQKQTNKPVDISHSLALSISSNIITLLIGRRLEKVKEADKIQLALDFSEACLTFSGPSHPAAVVPGLRRVFEILQIVGYDRAARSIQNFSKFVRDEINGHKTSSMASDVNDFINIYLEKLAKMNKTEHIKHHFSEIMLEGNLQMLFLGASDTVLSSMGWLLRLTADHKDVQEKAYAELIEVFGKDGRATYQKRNKIPYAFAVLMEAQRFSSIVRLNTTRKCNQDIPINGLIIPKGSEIVANLWALHNDPEYWEEPEKFRPERFLLDNCTKLVKQPESYAPFSLGKRNCPGETIAWMEILAYFTEIIKKFEISTPDRTEDLYKVRPGLVVHLEPHRLIFKER